MNLSLPLFDAPAATAPPPQAGGGGTRVPAAAGATGVASAAPGGAGGQVPDAAVGTAGLAEPAAAPAAASGLDLARHPALWRASQIGGAARRVSASGFDALDAQLPGGGWPHGVLTELLLPEPGVGELRLLAPALAAWAPAGGAAGAAPGGAGCPAPHVVPAEGQRRGGPPHPAAGPAMPDDRCVMLFDPPALLSAWALAQCGLASRHWLVVQGRAGQGRAGPAGVTGPHAGPAGVTGPYAGPAGVTGPHAGPAGVIAPGAPRGANRLAPLLPSADLLWALEQSLRSGHLGVALAWLPLNLRADALRRLQLAAQSHDGPVFVFRDALARSQPSPAPLRLLLQPAGVDQLSVRLLKRRGPALAQPLRLALPPVLAPHLQARAELRQLARQWARAPVPGPGPAGRPALADARGREGGA